MQARVQGGGARGLPPPPLEIEKQKQVIRANLKLCHLYFATFSVGSIIFSAIFGAGPPLEKLKSQKMPFRFSPPPPPPPYEFLDTPLTCGMTCAYIILTEHNIAIS